MVQVLGRLQAICASPSTSSHGATAPARSVHGFEFRVWLALLTLTTAIGRITGQAKAERSEFFRRQLRESTEVRSIECSDLLVEACICPSHTRNLADTHANTAEGRIHGAAVSSAPA